MYVPKDLRVVAKFFLLSIMMPCVAMEHDRQLAYHNQRSEAHISFEKLLINDPLQALRQCLQLRVQFLTELKDQHVFDTSQKCPAEAIRMFMETCRSYEKQNPLFLLSECTHSECPLRRVEVADARKKFETAVAVALTQVSMGRGSVTYAGFGTGDCFPDVRALTMVLSQFPQSAITIHFIDALETLYVHYKDMVFYSREVFPDEAWREPIAEVSDVLRSHVVDDVTKFFDENMLDSYVVEDVLLQSAQKRQIIAWFRTMFPRAETRLFVHSGVEQYLSYVKDANMPLPDVLVAADIHDEKNIKLQAIPRYGNLVLTTLAHNRDARNLFLSYEQGRPIISSCSTTPIGIQLEQKLFMSGDPIPVYFNRTPLDNVLR